MQISLISSISPTSTLPSNSFGPFLTSLHWSPSLYQATDYPLTSTANPDSRSYLDSTSSHPIYWQDAIPSIALNMWLSSAGYLRYSFFYKCGSPVQYEWNPYTCLLNSCGSALARSLPPNQNRDSVLLALIFKPTFLQSTQYSLTHLSLLKRSHPFPHTSHFTTPWFACPSPGITPVTTGDATYIQTAPPWPPLALPCEARPPIVYWILFR